MIAVVDFSGMFPQTQSGYVFMPFRSNHILGWLKTLRTSYALPRGETSWSSQCSVGDFISTPLLEGVRTLKSRPHALFTDNSANIIPSKAEKRLGKSKHFLRLHWRRHMVERKKWIPYS